MVQSFEKILLFVLLSANSAVACVTLSCTDVDSHDNALSCGFALYNPSLLTFQAYYGYWSEDFSNIIYNLTTALYDVCPGCILSINNSTVQNVSVLFQISNGNESKFLINQSGVSIYITGYEKCNTNTTLKEDPNACLNLSLYTRDSMLNLTTCIPSTTLNSTTVLTEGATGQYTSTLAKTQPAVVTESAETTTVPTAVKSTTNLQKTTSASTKTSTTSTLTVATTALITRTAETETTIAQDITTAETSKQQTTEPVTESSKVDFTTENSIGETTTATTEETTELTITLTTESPRTNLTTTELNTGLTTAAETTTIPTEKIKNESITETTTWETEVVISTALPVTSASKTMHGSTIPSTASTWIPSTTPTPLIDQQTQEEIVNNLVQAEIAELGLSLEEKVIFHGEPPRYGQQSLTSYSNLRLQLPAGLKEDQVGMVYSQFKLPLSTKQHARVKKERNQVQSVVPWPGSPVLSISAINLVTNSTVQANLSYSIVLNATTRSLNPLASAIESKSDGSVVRLKKVDNLCGFFDRDSNTFSTKGCSLTKKISNTVTCFCTHTTLFAVLLSVQTYEVPAAVKVLSYVLESFSILCLLVTVATLLVVRKKVRSDRTVVQINLTIALLFFHIFNVFQDAALFHKSSCELVTVMIHLFLLSTGTWMTIEAFTMFIKTTSQVLSFNKKSPKKIAYAKLGLGWGIPTLIVIISTTVGFPTARYMDHEPLYDKYYKRCWVSSEHWMLVGAVIIPLSIIYAVNLIIAFRMIWFVHRMRTTTLTPPTSGSKRSDSVRESVDLIGASLKVFVMLFPVLGIPLIFSFLTSVQPYEASVAFMYVNVILNGLQGLFLLLVYCVLGSEVREASLRKIERFQLRYQSEDSSHVHSKGTPATHSTNLPAKSANNVI